MEAPDKIYIHEASAHELSEPVLKEYHIEYIRKDALLEWLDKELDRLYELLPDASNENPSQMELRYLGQYVQTEKLFDKLKDI